MCEDKKRSRHVSTVQGYDEYFPSVELLVNCLHESFVKILVATRRYESRRQETRRDAAR